MRLDSKLGCLSRRANTRLVYMHVLPDCDNNAIRTGTEWAIGSAPTPRTGAREPAALHLMPAAVCSPAAACAACVQKAVNAAGRGSDKLKEAFRDLQERSSKVSQIGTRIGARLQSADNLRARAMELVSLMHYLQLFAKLPEGDAAFSSALPALFWEDKKLVDAAVRTGLAPRGCMAWDCTCTCRAAACMGIPSTCAMQVHGSMQLCARNTRPAACAHFNAGLVGPQGTGRSQRSKERCCIPAASLHKCLLLYCLPVHAGGACMCPRTRPG